MFWMTQVGNEGLIESYKARFKPNADAGGYLYNPDDYGQGVSCDAMQYRSYVSEFETFVARCQRFMIWWMVAIVLLGGIGAVLAGFYIESDIFEIKLFDTGFGVLEIAIPTLVASPLIYFFIKGKSLYQKPTLELGSAPSSASTASLATGRRHGSVDIMDRRIKGMSPSLILAGTLLPVFGVGVSAKEYLDTRVLDPSWFVFPVMFLAFGFLAWRRRKIIKQDEAILHQQTLFSAQNAQSAWLELNHLAVHSVGKAALQNCILSVPVPLKGTSQAANSDPVEYFHTLLDSLGQLDGLFVLSLDWKEGIEEYYAQINAALGERSADVELPALDNYPPQRTVSYPNVFFATGKALSEAGMRQIFLQDGSDTYHLILIENSSRDDVVDCLNSSHLEYWFDEP